MNTMFSPMPSTEFMSWVLMMVVMPYSCVMSEIGMLFQGSALFDNETVLGNVMFPLKMFSCMSHKEQLERAHY